MFKQSDLVAGLLFAIIVALAGIFLQNEKIQLLSLAAFFIPAIALHYFEEYSFEQRKRQIEDEVPDVLLLASSLPESSLMLKLVDFVCANSKGPIAKEFSTAQRQIKSGLPIEDALWHIKERNKSASLSRTIELILSSLKSGSDMRETFRQAADDFIEINSILRERSAAVSVQKYTLLAGCILVPLILGMVSSIDTDFASFDGLGIGMEKEEKEKIREFALIGNQVYIFEYVLLACFFVAFLEGIPKKAVLYIVCFLPVSFAVYFLAGKF